MRILELKVLVMQKSSSYSVTISYTLMPTVVKYFTLYLVEIKPGFLFYLLRLINYNLLSQSILYKCMIDCK